MKNFELVMLVPFMGFVFIVFMFGFMMYQIFTPSEWEKDQKLDRCIKFANELGLDPNDEKPTFIKTCYEE